MAKLRTQQFPTTSLVASTTAPASPSLGQIWYKPETAVSYQYTTDGASSFWLDISSGGIGTSARRGVDFVGDIDPHKATNLGAVGSVYYNREANRHFVCTTATSGAQVWSGRYAGTGGALTEYLLSGTYYRVHTFLGSGTFTMDGATTCDILIVAGGGAGGSMGFAGSNGGGAGGAGGFVYYDQTSVSTGAKTVVVGIGGAAGVNTGVSGSNSSFASLTAAVGGGRGGGVGAVNSQAGASGGSGGGGGNDNAAGGARTLNQGFAGGAGRYGGGTTNTGGGGGGASATGGDALPGGAGYAEGATVYDWDAGSGTVTFPATFTNGSSTLTYAGGGGGGRYSGAGQAGGAGGGGAGGAANSAGTNGTDGLGGGGGGGSYTSTTIYAGGSGGNGIVIIRYALS